MNHFIIVWRFTTDYRSSFTDKMRTTACSDFAEFDVFVGQHILLGTSGGAKNENVREIDD